MASAWARPSVDPESGRAAQVDDVDFDGSCGVALGGHGSLLPRSRRVYVSCLLSRESKGKGVKDREREEEVGA